MDLSTLHPPEGSQKSRKRVGRGNGSGHGGTSCRGHKGLKARSGGTVRPGFEGGQMPMARRLPKRGFRNYFRKEWVTVNVEQLNLFEANAVVDAEALLERGLIKTAGSGVKILGRGDLAHPLSVKVDAISEGARQKITAAGGTILEKE